MNFSIRQIIHSYTNFNNFPYQIRSSVSRKRVEVVLNYYGEDVANVARFIRYLKNISTLKKLQAHIILYNKYSIINNTLLKALLKVDIVQGLPNTGREGATYLYHIIENYDQLANHILFSQAGVDGMTDTGLKDWFLHRLEKQFNSSVGYMPLVGKKEIDTFDCGVRKGKNDDENMQRLPELWGIMEQTLCPPGGQAVAFRGQFIVSAKRIRNRPLRVYKYIYELLTADQTHWIHNDSRSENFVKSTPQDPKFGHVVERIWTTLFNCTKPDLIDRCLRNECACFD